MVSQELREDAVTQIKDRADIVQIIGEAVDLKKSGARFLGLCPFHGEKTPSFTVHPGQQFFHCFGCGESGDVLSFMMKYHNLDFPSALKELAGRYGITLPEKPRSPEQEKQDQLRKQMFEVSGKVSEIYRRYLKSSSHAGSARSYLEKRGITKEIQERFGLGYAPSVDDEGWDYLSKQLNDREKQAAIAAGIVVKKERGGTYDRFRDRVLFPIHEISGRVCGFGGRIVGKGDPKYLNSPESPIYNKSKLLLGLFQQKDSIRRKNQAIIVEGNFDLIALANHGCDNVVAPLGTALTREQLRLLKRFAEEVVLLFDGDAAGIKAAVRSVPHFLAEQVSGKVVLLPPEHDPDTFVTENGVEAVYGLIEKAETLPEFVFNQLVKEFGLSLNGKSRIVEELRPLVKAAASPLQRSVIVSHFAEQLGLAADQLDGMLDKSTVASPQVLEEPPPPVALRRKEVVEPMSKAQRRLVEFMVLNPDQFNRLEEGGIRECLAGSVGEILLLQIKHMLKERGSIEPEEMLAILPAGVERQFVADLLLDAPELGEVGSDSSAVEAEAEELLDWMKVYVLKRSSQRILSEINQIQKNGNFQRLQELIIEKQEIDRKLKGVNM